MPKQSAIALADAADVNDSLLGLVNTFDRRIKIGKEGGVALHDYAIADYDTLADVGSIPVPAVRTFFRTAGFAAAGDGGAALYKRAAAEPTHAGKKQDALGNWWEIAERQIAPQMLGAKGDGTTNDTTALTNADAVAVALRCKLVGHGIYLISATVTLKSESVDFSAAMIKMANSFTDPVGISYESVTNDLDFRGTVIINIDGNRANQATSLVAVRIRRCPSPHVEVHVRGKNCGTVCQVIDNAERLKVWASGDTSDLVLHCKQDVSSPDENYFHITGGNCTQWYWQEGSCTTDVHFNVQSQSVGATVYPIVIEGERHARLSGIMRSTQFGAIKVNQNNTTDTTVDFAHMTIMISSGAPAILVNRTRVLNGSIVLLQASNGGADIQQCSGGNLDIAIQNLQSGIGVKLGDTAGLLTAAGLNLRLSYTHGAVGLVALRTERVDGCDVTYLGSALPIEITDTIANGMHLSLPVSYLTGNVSVSVTAAATPTIEFVGRAATTDLTGYSTPARGMRATQYSSQLQTPAYYTGRGSTGGWQVPDVSDLGAANSNGGAVTGNGTGAQVTFSWAHGLGTTPKEVSVDPGSADAAGDFYVAVSSTNISVTYAAAPPSGTGNLAWWWRART